MGALGMEPDISLYLNHMMQVMAEVWRVLRKDGVCFVNIGDSYFGGGRAGHNPDYFGKHKMFGRAGWDTSVFGKPMKTPPGMKAKSLCLIPQKFAVKCQEAGWIIRSEIIWAKGVSFAKTYSGTVMPESVRDRCTKAHEIIWMMTKEQQYFWNPDGLREALCVDTIPRAQRGRSGTHKWSDGGPGNHTIAKDLTKSYNLNGRNARDVWCINPEPTSEAHFATWPSQLVEKMIRAASKLGDIVLDPFCGTGKTVIEAERLNRIGIGLDLSYQYLRDIAKPRLERPIQKELAVL